MAPAMALFVAAATCGPLLSRAFELTAPPPRRHLPRRAPIPPSPTAAAPPARVRQQLGFGKRKRTLSFAATSSSDDAAEAAAATAPPRRRGPGRGGEELFQRRLAELRDFRAAHGHGSVPVPYPPNPALGVWAANLRRQHALWERAGGDDEGDGDDARGGGGGGGGDGGRYEGYLTSQRRRQLTAAGFDFSSLTERQFRARLEELEQFKERYDQVLRCGCASGGGGGDRSRHKFRLPRAMLWLMYDHCMVPEKWEENAALGAWVSNLRSLYKRRRRALLLDSRQRDEARPKGDEKRATKRMARRSKKNMLLQPRPLPSRKRRPRFSHLDEDRIRMLEDMGFAWSSLDRQWMEMLEWAKVYGVVNAELGLSDFTGNATWREEGCDARGDGSDFAVDLGQNGTEQHDRRNHTLVLDNYRKFVVGIQNISLLPRFHPQDRILDLLSETTYELNGTDRLQLLPAQHTNMTYQPDEDAPDGFQSAQVDYRISPNDTLHLPLRIWMINQRSGYNRLQQAHGQTVEVRRTMSPALPVITAQRQKALEGILFPWSGRFRNRNDEVQYEMEQVAKADRIQENELRRERREREEMERVERLLKAPISSTGPGDENRDSDEISMQVDIMALWDAGEDEDDEDDW
ncbi:hypothetical protein ACHAWF_008571 [Thalassiosira exigua]